jgi:hypothetical protein
MYDTDNKLLDYSFLPNTEPTEEGNEAPALTDYHCLFIRGMMDAI